MLKASPNLQSVAGVPPRVRDGLRPAGRVTHHALTQVHDQPAATRAGVQSDTWDRQAHLAVGIRAWNDWLSVREGRFYRFTRKSLPMPDGEVI